MDSARVAHAFARLAELANGAEDQADLLVTIARRYQETLERGGTLYFAGNGGSAADAQHIAAEYVVRRGRRGASAVALTTDTSLLTAAGNDLGFDQVFACQVESVMRTGDLLILHSTSGDSANLIAAAAAARRNKIEVVAFLGSGGGRLAGVADVAFVVPSDEVARIQEIHLAAEHIIVGLLEDAR